MCVGFATTVPGWRNAHQTRVEFVLHVAFQDAVFDQHVVLPRRAFIIDRDRTATIGHGAIIHNGTQFRGHQLAHLAAEYGGAATVEIAFQTVTDRFVQ
ncbi:hypothetical protein D3C81_1702500 [compost metagenome]